MANQNLIKSLILEFRRFSIYSHSSIFAHAVIIKIHFTCDKFQLEVLEGAKMETKNLQRFHRMWVLCFYVLSYFCSHEAIIIIVVFYYYDRHHQPWPRALFVQTDVQQMENRCPNDAQTSDLTSKKLHTIVIKSVLRMSFIVGFFTTPIFSYCCRQCPWKDCGKVQVLSC